MKKTIFKNGLRIITAPQPRSQAVTILVLAGTGSEYEEKEISGISHFLEHMFFKGTLKRPNTIAIAESLDRVGGSYNAFTGEEYTGYYAKVNATHFDLALDWVSDIFLNSKLEAEEIEREKGVIIEEINMYYDNPSSHVQTLWRELLYGDQPAGWNIAGAKETVSAINRDKLVHPQKYALEILGVILGGMMSSRLFVKVRERLGLAFHISTDVALETDCGFL